MVFYKLYMANPDQKTILIDQAFKDIKEICKKFQDESGVPNSEVKVLLEEIAILWESKKK